MSDYCKQCSIELFNKDYKELADITKPEDEARNVYAIVLCEGCGCIQVNTEGSCVTPNCLRKHGAANAHDSDR